VLLGEALSLRSRQAQQLDDLRGRIKANAIVQEGTEPSEDPGELIDVFEQLSDEHAGLVERIARTNHQGKATNGDNMLHLLHQREALRRKRSLHEMVASVATPDRSNFRFIRTELKYVSEVDVPEHRKLVDELDQAIRALDALIQESNWRIELA
jgi:hypothetical protein